MRNKIKKGKKKPQAELWVQDVMLLHVNWQENSLIFSYLGTSASVNLNKEFPSRNLWI